MKNKEYAYDIYTIKVKYFINNKSIFNISILILF